MADKALGVMRYLPRVCLHNIRDNTHTNMKKRKSERGQHRGGRHGEPHKGPKQRMRYPKIGYEYGRVPYYLRMPMEPYYKNHHLKRQYPPLSLHALQLMIDNGRLDPKEPIDLGTICATFVYTLKPEERHFGVQLTDTGIDSFSAKVNIEVQHASEAVIAAIERNGGVITTAYYDIPSIRALINPIKLFTMGKPIPKRLLPPEDAIEYYSEAKNRGYLADPEKISFERLVLSQKYGYALPDISKDALRDMMLLRKDPRQIFYGLRPGWVVNLKDKTILEPLNSKLREYYELDEIELDNEKPILEKKIII